MALTQVSSGLLTNTAVTSGTYGGSSAIPVITVDAQGRLQSAANVTVNIPSTAYVRTSFTATAGQTSFSVNYSVGYAQVFVNGVMLNAADYTASSGTAVVLAVAANAGDIVEVVAFNATQISNASSANNIYGGSAGAVAYQTGASQTGFTGVGTTGQILTSGGTGAPTFVAQTSLSIANTQITGLITSGQIATVANTQVTGLITSGQIASVANTQVTGTFPNTCITGVMTTSQGGTGLSTVGTTGQVLCSTGSALVYATPSTYTPSSWCCLGGIATGLCCYTVPSGKCCVRIYAVGAGGAGACTPTCPGCTSIYQGGGGAGGGMAYGCIAVTPGSVICACFTSNCVQIIYGGVTMMVACCGQSATCLGGGPTLYCFCANGGTACICTPCVGSGGAYTGGSSSLTFAGAIGIGGASAASPLGNGINSDCCGKQGNYFGGMGGSGIGGSSLGHGFGGGAGSSPGWLNSTACAYLGAPLINCCSTYTSILSGGSYIYQQGRNSSNCFTDPLLAPATYPGVAMSWGNYTYVNGFSGIGPGSGGTAAGLLLQCASAFVNYVSCCCTVWTGGNGGDFAGGGGNLIFIYCMSQTTCTTMCGGNGGLLGGGGATAIYQCCFTGANGSSVFCLFGGNGGCGGGGGSVGLPITSLASLCCTCFACAIPGCGGCAVAIFYAQ